MQGNGIDKRPCKYCSIPADLECQVCFESYCSTRCQKNDWSFHKSTCIPMPSLVSRDSGTVINESISSNSKEIQHHRPNDEKKERFDVNQRLRLPQIQSVPNFSHPPPTPAVLTNGAPAPPTVKAGPRNERLQMNGQRNVESSSDPPINKLNGEKILKRSDTPHVLPLDAPKFTKPKILFDAHAVSAPPKNEPAIITMQQSVPQAPVIVTPAPVITQKPEPVVKKTPPSPPVSVASSKRGAPQRQLWQTPTDLKFNELMTVVVADVPVGQMYDLWVQDKHYQDDGLTFLADLNKPKLPYIKCDDNKIKFGNLYVVMFEEFLYRGEVIEEKNPFGEFKIRLIDYGNEFYAKAHEIMVIPENYKTAKCFAFKIRLPVSNSAYAVDSELKVHLTGTFENGAYVALLEGMNVFVETVTEIAAPAEVKTLKEVWDQYMEEPIRIAAINSPNSAVCVLVKKSHDASFQDWLNSPTNFKMCANQECSIGDIVLAQMPNKNWIRAMILGRHCKLHIIFALDYGKIEITEHIRKVQDDIVSKVPVVVVFLTISKVLIDEEKFITDFFYENSCVEYMKKDDKFVLLDSNDLHVADIGIKFWDVTLEMLRNSIKYWRRRIRPQTLVRISAVYAECSICIANDDKLGLYCDIFNEIGAAAKTFEEKPKVDDIVLVKSESSSKFYRGMILEELADKKKYRVVNADNGWINEETTTSLRYANSFVHFAPIYTMNVFWESTDKLKSKSTYIVDYLLSISKTMRFTILETPGAPMKPSLVSEDAQPLDSLINEVLNKTIKPIAPATSPRPTVALPSINGSDENGIVEFDAIEMVEIPAGKKIKLMVMDHTMLERGYITASCYDLPGHEAQQLREVKLNEYCAKSDMRPYSPKPNEVCLAMFSEDKLWYRASCLSVTETLPAQFKVIYLDYGNVSSQIAKYIRKIPKEFVYPTYGNTCIIKDHKMTPENVAKLRDHINNNSSVIVVDEVVKLETGYMININDLLSS